MDLINVQFITRVKLVPKRESLIYTCKVEDEVVIWKTDNMVVERDVLEYENCVYDQKSGKVYRKDAVVIWMHGQDKSIPVYFDSSEEAKDFAGKIRRRVDLISIDL